MNIYKEIFDAATLIKENNIKGEANQGLCKLIYDNMNSVNDYEEFMIKMSQCAMKWDEYSGYSIFPVPSPVKEYNAIEIYFLSEYHNYEGEYGEARMRYLDHVIKWAGAKANG